MAGVAAGYLVTHDWRGALVGGIAGLLPDIDEPRSMMGRPFFFLSAPLNAIVGHRTLTHSLLAVLAIWLVLLPFSREMALAAVSGMVAHIIGDMVTGKVQVLWPVPMSIGVSVPRVGYYIIDRLVRYGLLLYVFLQGVLWVYDWRWR